MTFSNSNFPDKEGFYGEYGGKFVPETMMYALEELENTYNKLKDIDTKKHGLIVSSHPSPLSVYRSLGSYPPFCDSCPFTQINEYCALKGKGVFIDFNTSGN